MGKKPYTLPCIINPATGRACKSTSALGRRLIRRAGYSAGAFLPSRQPGYKGPRGYRGPRKGGVVKMESLKRKAGAMDASTRFLKRVKLSNTSGGKRKRVHYQGGGVLKRVKLSNTTGGKRKRGQFQSGLPSGSARRAPPGSIQSMYTAI